MQFRLLKFHAMPHWRLRSVTWILGSAIHKFYFLVQITFHIFKRTSLVLFQTMVSDEQ